MNLIRSAMTFSCMVFCFKMQLFDYQLFVNVHDVHGTVNVNIVRVSVTSVCFSPQRFK